MSGAAQLFKAPVQFDAEEGTIIMPIDPVDVSPPIDAILEGGVRFNPKSELHITILGRIQAKNLKAKGITHEQIAGLLQRLPRSWRVARQGRWWRIDHPDWDNGRGRSSIIQEVQCREAEVFFVGLTRETGVAVTSPPFHITWYVYHDDRGIPVPDVASLEKYGTRLEGWESA
jgi:hypothetical protein